VDPPGPVTGVLHGTNLVMEEVTVTSPCGGGGGVEVGGGGGGFPCPQPALQEVTVMVLVV